MAAFRCLCKPWSILLARHTNSGGFRIPFAFERKRPVDRHSVWLHNPDTAPFFNNKLHKLAASGMFFIVILACNKNEHTYDLDIISSFRQNWPGRGCSMKDYVCKIN